MRPFDIRNVNRPNSYEWSRCNNESRSHFWRSWVCETYGGQFSRELVGKALIWKWNAPPDEERAKWVFMDAEGNKHMVSNFVGFCKEHKLDDGRMYDTYTGKRNHHKGWKVSRLYGIEGKKNPKDFGRNLPPPARS